MKKSVFVLFLSLFLNQVIAQISKVVNVSTAGTLSSLLTTTEKTSIINLTVSGNLDARDFKCMRDEMTMLATLDMTDITIKAFYGSSGTVNSIVSYPINEIPQYSFCNNTNGKITLKAIKLPTSITSIGNSSFMYCKGLVGNLIIPNSVTSIGSYAFYGCHFSGRLTIPNSVTIIKDNAFSGCYISGLIIGSSVGSIGANAFENCGLLIELTIGKSVFSIGSNAFSYCFSIMVINSLNTTPPKILATTFSTIPTVYVPEANLSDYKAATVWKDFKIATVKNIIIDNPTAGGLAAAIISAGYGPLNSITHLTVTGNLNSVDISQMKTNMTVLTDIDMSSAILLNNNLPTNAFVNKTTLSSVRLPLNLEVIGANAFSGCSSLISNISLPATIKEIGNSAYKGCSGLSGDLSLPTGITKLNDSVFYGCRNITGSILIPEKVTSIGTSTFYNCCNLSGTISIPNSVISIGNFAFSNCSSLSGSLNIPNSVTSIGNSAFSFCKGLTGSLIIPNNITTINNGVFYNCSGLIGALTIPNSVTTISDNAFSECNKISELYISKNTTSIGSAFFNCIGLKKISVACVVPPIININTFKGVNKESCTLEVPIGSSYTYQTTNFWSDFIFLTEKNIDTSIGKTQIANSDIKVYTSPSSIIISGSLNGEKIVLFDVKGMVLQTIRSQGEDIKIPVQKNAVYFVKTQSTTFKVIL